MPETLDKHRLSGFTLIELVIVLALVAILATVAVPSFNRLVDSNRLTGATNDLIGVVTFARSEAIRYGRSVTVSPRTVTVAGAAVTSYENGAEVAVGSDQLRVTSPAATGISISDPGSFSFRGNGLATSSVTLKVCNSASEGREVNVSLGGQVRVVSVGVTCP